MRRTSTTVVLPALMLALVSGVLAQAPSPELELTEEEKKAEEAFSLADGLFRKGFHDRALAKFVEFVQQYPTHANAALALFLAGECHYVREQYAEAVPLYGRVLTEYPNCDEVGVAAYRVAHCKYQTKDYQGATAAFEDLLKRVPDTQYKPASYYWIGECRFLLGQYDEAIEAYEQSRKLAPQGEFAAWAAYSIGMSYLELGNADAALASFRTVAQDYADSPVAAECDLRVGDALREAGKTTEAIASYQSVLKRGEARLAPGALHGLGWSQCDTEEWGKAQGTFERLLKDHADSPFAPGARRGLANCLYHQKKHAEAAKAYEAAREGAAADVVPELLFWQAASLELAGDADGARVLFKRVVDEHPGHPLASKAALRLADASAEGEDLDAAEASYKAAAASDDPELRARGKLGLAWVLYQRGDKAGALKQYEEIAKEDAASEAGGAAAIQGAQIAYGENDHAKTIELTRVFLQHHVDDEEALRAHCLQGLSLAATDNPQEAVAELQQAVEGAPKADFTANALTTLAQLHRKLGSDAKADEALARLKRDFPESTLGAEAQYDSAAALFEAGKYAQARKAYEDVLKATDREDIAGPAQYWIGVTYLREDQTEQALAAFSAVIGKYPESTAAGAAQHQVGVGLLQMEKYAEATEALAKFIADHPDDELVGQARAELAWAYLKAGDTDKAKAMYERLAGGEGVPTDQAGDALLKLGEMAYSANDHEAALTSYDEIIEKHADSQWIDEAHYKRGWALLELKRTDEAAEAFRKCLTAKPDKGIAADCHFQIGLALADGDDVDGAIAELDGFLGEYKDEPTAPWALLILAELYAQKGDWPKTEETINAAPTSGEEPYMARRALALGRALRGLDRADEAAAQLEKAVELAKGNMAADARFELAAAQLAAGKHDAAADGFLNVAILHGDSSRAPEALYQAGRCFEAAGDKDEAVKAYQSLTKDYPDAAEWVEKAEARLQELGG